ncbi:glycyl-tRNA synthetase beta chain [Alkalithermobacter thermoalcaliphilus JW-YL-7 = DSM 7308]|uniref:Glycine--tRNA ligase beta subunit n=1 Tax=Alkalithermobacter thermoalcaliphilus JW-YL-7 = DSM 7308 TaxID=1121328 RepID=A0A150FQ04_CLOPD|nr:Glycyl-tRNA synthetase beta subunit [[Clostridium] paradoxum JW-YL-7 = DSM 7308]SHK64447.1 glycyl-tRNA synthetase beta chain [[Clostridium] paradoxum JW-YL-7 = DSM 7308]
MNKCLLFEIGTEEIPARFINSAIDQIKQNTQKIFNENRLSFGQICVYTTPRRLTLVVNDLKEMQSDLEEEVKGPSKKIAFDENNNPTKPLEGFMKSKGLTLENIYFKQSGKEEYVYGKITQKGRDTKEVLKEVLPEIVKSITFPKSMRWGGKNLRFARPIRWMVCLYGQEVVQFEVEGIKSSNITRGHRFLGSDSIKVDSLEDYLTKLRENYVILDQNERKQIIKQQCMSVAESLSANLLLDEELLEEVTYIVEYPTAFYGNFKQDYLSLPKEVIITPMKEHQRYFPVIKEDGSLLPNFVTVRNGTDYKIDNVRKGNEKVLEARLADALFFYKEDIKKPLDEYIDKLKNVVFQEKLGTVYDKTERIQSLSQSLIDALDYINDKEDILRVARLCKADLVTNMVFEFTELQGIMGREYAKVYNEKEVVSQGIYEHYLPRFSGDDLPQTKAGIVVSLADKLDTIAGFFAIGIQPTGSNDPYALRRQALGIINIIMEKDITIDLENIIADALDNYKHLEFDKEKVVNEVVDFFKQRIKNMFSEMGIRYDVIDAVLNQGINDIANIYTKAKELNTWINKDEIVQILTVFNRVSSLAEKAVSKEISEEYLIKNEEKILYNMFKDIRQRVDKLIKDRNYSSALDEFIKLKDPIDTLFNTVMIMDKDEKIKNNRLALLRQITDTMLSICDLSKIVYK